VIAFDFPLRLRVIRCASGVRHATFAEVFPEFAGYVSGAIVAE
jgi:hypothetical protein